MLAALGNTKLAGLLLKVFASDSRLRRRLMDPAHILQGAQVRAGQTVLEVGCGRGFFTIPAAEIVGQQGRLYALDVAGAAVEYVARKAQAAGLANVTTIRADGAATGLPEGEMDLVLLLGVIPAPTLPLRRLLPEMQRVLKPGGALAVWTAVPGWSPASITRNGLFTYLGKENGVYNFRETGCSELG
jgi:ubiquinone/menaquinone biosynthesis C-methylase UbiE